MRPRPGRGFLIREGRSVFHCANRLAALFDHSLRPINRLGHARIRRLSAIPSIIARTIRTPITATIRRIPAISARSPYLPARGCDPGAPL